jgi:hypothetical protein
LRPTRPIVMLKTSRRLRLASVHLYPYLSSSRLRLAGTANRVYFRHAKGPAIAESFMLYLLRG